jgi:hypothetical protein
MKNIFIRNQKSFVVNIFLLTALVFTTGCQQPDELIPPVARLGLNSVTASFEDGSGDFTGMTPEDGNEILIVIPYYFPENSTNQVTAEQLKRMRVKANLDDNVSIDPPLRFLDMTQDNIITVTNQKKEKKKYIIKAEIRKSAACAIEEFKFLIGNNASISGVINETAKTISLIGFNATVPILAELTLSPHATIEPDPRTTAFLYDEEVKFTVTAHDGVTKSVYTVNNETPEKIDYGIRPYSGKIMFAKRLNADLGITTPNMTGGIAVTRDYVILNTRNENSIYIDAKTGDKLGEIVLSEDMKGDRRNFYSTADKAGNVVISNWSRDNGDFKVWRLQMDGTTQELISWDNSDVTPPNIGHKISIQGDLDENAIITAALLYPWSTAQAYSHSFACWTVVNGVLTSHTPEIITIASGGLTNGWAFNNCDIVSTSDTDINADYFLTYYSVNTFAWINGTTRQVRAKLEQISPNYVPNAVDYIEFNNAKYTTLNWSNSNPWGQADIVWLLDVATDANFSGNLETQTCPAVVWECPKGTYGPDAIQPVVLNASNTGDVALFASGDGYYLYLYFMFTNGYVVGVQFDCIDM